jgi:hypothetical protein
VIVRAALDAAGGPAESRDEAIEFILNAGKR